MNKNNEIEDVIMALKKTAKSILNRRLSIEKMKLLDLLGVEYTIYNNKETNVAELFNDDMIFLFEKVLTGRYSIIAQVSADKVLHITDEQKEELGL